MILIIMPRKCKKCGQEFQTLVDDLYCSFECAYDIDNKSEIKTA